MISNPLNPKPIPQHVPSHCGAVADLIGPRGFCICFRGLTVEGVFLGIPGLVQGLRFGSGFREFELRHEGCRILRKLSELWDVA